MVMILHGLPTISAGDVEVVSIDYTDWLDSGELLTGTPTVTEQITSDLTISNKAVSTSSLTILDRTVATGAAVQFKITGHKAGKIYRVRISVGTDATPARTAVRDIRFEVQ